MAVLRLARWPVGQDVYDTVIERMRLHTEHPLGLILHSASEVDGELQVTQVWDSLEYALRFEEEILAPALVASGVTRPSQVRLVELHDLVTP